MRRKEREEKAPLRSLRAPSLRPLRLRFNEKFILEQYDADG